MEQVPQIVHVAEAVKEAVVEAKEATVITTTPVKGAVAGETEVTPEGLAQKLFPSPSGEPAVGQMPVIVEPAEAGLAGGSPPMDQIPPSFVEPPVEAKVPIIIPDVDSAALTGEKRGLESPAGAFETTAASAAEGPPLKKAKTSPKKQSATSSPAKKT
jgi:hypothetical protein